MRGKRVKILRRLTRLRWKPGIKEWPFKRLFRLVKRGWVEGVKND